METGLSACFFLHWNDSYNKNIDINIVFEDFLLCIGCTLQISMLEYCAHNVTKENETKWEKIWDVFA